MIPLLKEILIKEVGEANIPPLPFTRINKLEYKSPVNIENFSETITVKFQDFHGENITDFSRQYYLPNFLIDLPRTYNVVYSIGESTTQLQKTNIKILLSSQRIHYPLNPTNSSL
jgi:hypothetical protein